MKGDDYETKDLTKEWNNEFNRYYVCQSLQTGLHFFDKKRKYKFYGKVRLSQYIYGKQINLNKNYILFKMADELWVYNFQNRSLFGKCYIPREEKDKQLKKVAKYGLDTILPNIFYLQFKNQYSITTYRLDIDNLCRLEKIEQFKNSLRPELRDSKMNNGLFVDLFANRNFCLSVSNYPYKDDLLSKKQTTLSYNEKLILKTSQINFMKEITVFHRRIYKSQEISFQPLLLTFTQNTIQLSSINSKGQYVRQDLFKNYYQLSLCDSYKIIQSDKGITVYFAFCQFYNIHIKEVKIPRKLLYKFVQSLHE
ncbi:UNKNOWN [Stylonychia lemnae]|uniref:Uncharacterized protein n=1 Tax=Stylonychia lemnae TaxID=5949 RepID=A0A078APE5_STYLE|nr:UNKNOWN [Stylonychia lemnae]|eukprot:CDW84240.1 UNKNOWN [Stylonychia lemnae]